MSSKLLDRKWREQEQMIHKRKLREAKSAIRPQQSKPYAPTITMRNAKKEAMLESKLQNTNCLSFFKMSDLHLYLFLLSRALHWNREGEPHFTRENVQHHAKLEAQPLQSLTYWEDQLEQSTAEKWVNEDNGGELSDSKAAAGKAADIQRYQMDARLLVDWTDQEQYVWISIRVRGSQQ